MQLLSTHYRNNSLPQDFCFKIYNFFEDFPGKNLLSRQELFLVTNTYEIFFPRFSFSMEFFSGFNKNNFFSWLDHSMGCIFWVILARITGIFFPRQNANRKTATHCKILTEIRICGRILDSYNVLCVSKYFLSGICHWQSCQDLKLICMYIQSKLRVWFNFVIIPITIILQFPLLYKQLTATCGLSIHNYKLIPSLHITTFESLMDISLATNVHLYMHHESSC